MNVMKIGGAVLKSPGGFLRMASIINAADKPAVVVISALAKTTRWLAGAARSAEQLDKDEYTSDLGRIIDFHSGLARKILNNNILPEALAFFQNTHTEISTYLESIYITNELTPRTLDIIMSFGEQLALKTIGLFLQGQGIVSIQLDAKEIIVTDNNFGFAKPIIPATKNNIDTKLIPILNENKVVLIPGFIARNMDGETTTMGMESSNLTAALLAELLGVGTLTIWTDVEGFMTADPRRIPEAVHLGGMNYRQATQAANNGLKLFHPEMITRARKKNIALIYRSAAKPNGNKSIINDETPAEMPVLILKEDVCFLRIQSISPKDSSLIAGSIEKAAGVSLLAVRRTLDSLTCVYADIHSDIDTESIVREINLPDNVNLEHFRNCSLITVMNITLRELLKITPEISEYFDENHNNHNDKEMFIFAGMENDTLQLLTSQETGGNVLKRLHKIIYESVVYGYKATNK